MSVRRRQFTGIAAASQGQEVADKQAVNVELVIAVDVSYSMDFDELAVQREGFAQAQSAQSSMALHTMGIST